MTIEESTTGMPESLYYAPITVEITPDGIRKAVVRTHDRLAYRRCRRLWGVQSAQRSGLQRIEDKAYFWFGTGGHFALEDFYGYKRYPTISDAFEAYARATQQDPDAYCPAEWRDLVQLAKGILSYYVDFWSSNRPHEETYWLNDVPQVEVDFEIPLDIELTPAQREVTDIVVYRGTLDRVAIVPSRQVLRIYEYKFPASFEKYHYETDEQVSSYMWACNHIYELPTECVVYQQHRKVMPEQPRFLKTTGSFSVAKDQTTTRTLYRAALINLYGSVEKAPAENVSYLNYLASMETEIGDKFIMREKVYRNDAQMANTDIKIKMEVSEMLNPGLGLYPNPTKDCSWDCPINTACTAFDDGASDWKQLLAQAMTPEKKERHSWRKYLP